MRQAEKVQRGMKQIRSAGASIVNAIIGKNETVCFSLSHTICSFLCFLLSCGLIFNHHVPCTLSGLSTDSAERQGSICGHVECRHHNGRWPIFLLLFTIHSEKSSSKLMLIEVE